MAGIFSLGRVSSSNNNQEGQEHNPIANQITPENWFWYNNKNDDVSYKRGTSTTTFELWQHQAELLHLQQRQQQDPYYSTTTAAGLGVGPSNWRSGINVVAGIGGGGISCQDCGNQAKKDCAHMRCRTCCKSRGFDCHTHVKSTWVPASKRRDKQQQQQQLQLQANKRHKENPSSSSLACSRLPSTNMFGFEVGNLPAEVSTEALFRCVKVCGIDDGEDQYAYQTSVNIGGHLFKGILYDQGPDESSSGGGIHEPVLNFINTSTSITTPTTMATAATTAADVAMASSSTAIFLDPSSLYPTPYTNFMATAGTQFFPNTRSS